MGNFITGIQIGKLRNLSNLTIRLNQKERQHLILTGKNGSGKTSLLLAIRACLQEIVEGCFLKENEEFRDARITFSHTGASEKTIIPNKMVMAFFPADRKTETICANGAEEVILKDTYKIDEEPGKLLHKYLVHLKTQQAYARNESDMEQVERIQAWFDRFERALRILLEDASLELEYDYKKYQFKFLAKGRNPFGLEELSDGYSAVIRIVSELMLRMDGNWLFKNSLSQYDAEGIVLIDELETHLHIELQKKILPFLTKFFPGLQFIVTTHSPYILNSVSNAKAFDLEKCMELENLSVYSSDGLAESYFGADEYSEELKEKLARYEKLIGRKNLTGAERAERAKLRIELKGIPENLSREARDKFVEIERGRL